MPRIGDNQSPSEVFVHRNAIYPKGPYYGWRDITSNVIVRGTGPTDPSWTQVATSPIYAYDFSVNDECWFVWHIPHDIVPGSPIFFHTHWMPDGTNVNTVKWQWEYVYALGFNQAAFAIGSETTIDVETTPPGTAYQHMISESTAQTIANLTEPDGIITAKVTRIANGGTDNTDSIFLLTSDLHYQSTNEATYNRTPNFYSD